MTRTINDIPMGPWDRNMSKIQPTNGSSISSFGGRNCVNAPAPAGEPQESRLYRYPVMPKAAMLMIVPAMIWSARTDIDSQACRVATMRPERTARRSAAIRTGVIPKIRPGPASPNTGTRNTPAAQATKAATSIVPSMPMLTTPDRSHMTPHSAASAIGTAERRMIGEMSGRIAMR